MATIANLDIVLGVNLSNFSKPIQQAQSEVSNLESSADGASPAIGGLGSAFGGLGAAIDLALGPLGLLIGALGAFESLKWAVGLAADAEQAEIAFRTMTGSLGTAKALIKDLKQFGAETPFEFPELREAAQKLLAFGFSAKEVQPQLKVLGDIASGTGKPIEDFVNILGKIKSVGKAGLEQTTQFAERGLPIYDALASTMGKTRGEIFKLISDGKIGFPEVQRALESMTTSGGIFNDAMKAQSGSLAGLWSTLQDNIGQAATEIGQAIVKAFDFKAITQWLSQFVADATALFMELIPHIMEIGNIFGVVVEIVGQCIQAILGWLSSLFSSITGSTHVWEDFKTGALTALVGIEFGLKNWEKVWDISIASTALSLVQWVNDFINFFTNVLPTALIAYGKFTMTFWLNLFTNIGNGFKFLWAKIRGQQANFDWKPLMEGAKQAFQEIEASFHRTETGQEKILREDLEKKVNAFNDEFQPFLEKRLKEFEHIGKQTEEQIQETVSKPLDIPEMKAEVKKTEKVKIEHADAPGAVEKGSAAAFDVIAQSLRRAEQDALGKAQLEQQKRAAEALKNIDRNLQDAQPLLVANIA